MRIVFPYIAQFHQIPHSLPIAAELALHHPGMEVHVAGATPAHLAFARRLIAEHAPQAALNYDLLSPGALDSLRLRAAPASLPWKPYLLFHNRRYFAGFDAVMTPERTSLLLRRFGLNRTRLIWTRHGAGDRGIGFAKDIRQFDFVLMAGRKIEQRLLAGGLIRPGDYVCGVYAKFDWALSRDRQPALFPNDRPTVLYNPHFRRALSSWPGMGRAVLDYFARSERYNLIFAPHVRLFDPPTPAAYRAFERYRGVSHLLIDLGSERSVDMSYTAAADLYLGDVSSQVAEFLVSPRPCVFLNAHAVRWQDDPNYRFWALGPVLDSVEQLDDALARAFDAHAADHAGNHAGYREAQRRYVAETFERPEGGSSAAIGAAAIVDYLRRTARRAGADSRVR